MRFEYYAVRNLEGLFLWRGSASSPLFGPGLVAAQLFYTKEAAEAAVVGLPPAARADVVLVRMDVSADD